VLLSAAQLHRWATTPPSEGRFGLADAQQLKWHFRINVGGKPLEKQLRS
jgi:hypothetical protein